MIYTIKKELQLIFKKFTYGLFKLFYGQIKEIKSIEFDKNSSIKPSQINESYTYKVYSVKKARLYTDTIHDTAIIQNNKIIKEASFQIRNVKFDTIEKNIVLSKGTPRFKKKIKGNIFSLLTGGAGNNNYWHWLFDVLPRIKILKNVMNLEDVDFFLFPELKQRFQKDSLDLLKIPFSKSLSSSNFRHLECDEIIVTDHPYIIKNDASNEIQNIPEWIIHWLKKTLTDNHDLADKNYPSKIYIDRSDSNIKSLRKIINEDEIINELKNDGYEVITLGNFSLASQMKYFYNARNIVGLHGAGFANFIFGYPGSNVLELKPSNAGDIFKNLANKCKLNYKCISVVPEKFNHQNQIGHIRIDLKELKRNL